MSYSLYPYEFIIITVLVINNNNYILSYNIVSTLMVAACDPKQYLH